MILDNFLKNLIYEPVSVLGLLVFYILLVNLPISLGAVFKKKSSFTVRILTILVNLLILITDHNVRETLLITNKSYVLSEGKILANGSSSELADNPIVKKYYLGDNFKHWNYFAKKI